MLKEILKQKLMQLLCIPTKSIIEITKDYLLLKDTLEHWRKLESNSTLISEFPCFCYEIDFLLNFLLVQKGPNPDFKVWYFGMEYIFVFTKNIYSRFYWNINNINNLSIPLYKKLYKHWPNPIKTSFTLCITFSRRSWGK